MSSSIAPRIVYSPFWKLENSAACTFLPFSFASVIVSGCSGFAIEGVRVACATTPRPPVAGHQERSELLIELTAHSVMASFEIETDAVGLGRKS